MNATLYTDASVTFERDGAKDFAAFAYWCRSSVGRIQRSGACPSQMPFGVNQAELFAIIIGLRDARDAWPQVKTFVVKTDNTAARDVLAGKKKPPAPMDRWLQKVSEGIKIIPVWVKGHRRDDDTESYINRWCDEASRAVWKHSRTVQKYKAINGNT